MQTCGKHGSVWNFESRVHLDNKEKSLSAISLPCMPMCDFTLSRIVLSPARARCMSSCPTASSSGLWQSSTVGDGDLKCMPTFCIEHYESVAMLSVTPGLQCLRAIRGATSSALLMVFSMHCPHGSTFRLRCACLCSFILLSQ